MISAGPLVPSVMRTAYPVARSELRKTATRLRSRAHRWHVYKNAPNISRHPSPLSYSSYYVDISIRKSSQASWRLLVCLDL